MALLDALGTHLQTNTVGTLGTNIMLGRMPDDPDVCVTLFESSLGPVHSFGASVSAVDRYTVRVFCRGTRMDYPGAQTKAAQVRAILGAVRNTSLSGVNILNIQSNSEPYPVRYDEDDRPIFGVDFSVWVTP